MFLSNVSALNYPVWGLATSQLPVEVIVSVDGYANPGSVIVAVA